jgi:hypothetical protein
MEWMLQAVDEVDDAVGALRLFAVGWGAELGAAAASGVSVCVICTAFITGAG